MSSRPERPKRGSADQMFLEVEGIRRNCDERLRVQLRTDSRRADRALSGARGKRLTYETVSARRASEARIVW